MAYQTSLKVAENDEYPFLSGGGEMGVLIRARDWTETPLGDPGSWPNSLRTMVSVMLDNPFGMYIAWGPEYTQLYNDGYRPILGASKHPQALGIGTKETFAEIWHIIGSMFDDVMMGKAIGFPDFMLPLNRNGFVEECFFDFSYSPIRKEDGQVGGVLVTVIETTAKKRAQDALKESEERFRTMAEASDVLIAVADHNLTTTFFNRAWTAFTGRSLEHLLQFGWEDIMHPGDRENFLKQSRRAIAEKSSFEASFRMLDKNGNYRWLLASIPARYNTDGSLAGYVSSCTDITGIKQAEQDLKEAEQNLRNTILQAPVAMCLFHGPKHVLELANEKMYELWGKPATVLLKKPIFEGLPEARGQGFEKLLDNVYATGETFSADGVPIKLPRKDELLTVYINFVYKAYREPDQTISGIMAVAVDVTEEVMARKRVEETKEKLNIVIEASELGTWELNLKTDLLVYSDAYIEIFGYQKGSVMSHRQFYNHLHPDDISIRNDAFALALKTGRLSYTARVIWNDGSIHWIEAKGKIFYDHDQVPERLIGTIRNVTRQKFYEQELEEREKKFRLLADAMPQHIWSADAAGQFNYFNKSLLNYAGISPEQLTGEGWLTLVAPAEREANSRAWLQAVAAKDEFFAEHRFRRQDGEYRWQLSRAVPQLDASGKVQLWVGSSTDIHNIKELDEQKDYFLSVVSHELKTPITSIKGYVQILSKMYKTTGDNILVHGLIAVDKQVDKLNRLISDLLDLSKIKSDSFLFYMQSFVITDLITEITAEIQHIYPDHDIVVLCQQPIVVSADREKIGQVLTNFLTNAIKYAPGNKRVEIDCIVNGKHITVSVRDFGIGINQKDQQRIFERFYRVEGKNEKTFPGFGIGLYIAAMIIQKHNGKIGVRSEPGKGSLFYFELPVEASQQLHDK